MPTDEYQQTQEQTHTQSSQPNFTRLLRRDKETYESVHKLVEHLATATGQEFGTLWAHVTERDDANYKRHFRRFRKKNDPFSDIKNTVPAYSFFTQEWNVKVAAEHPNLSFGDKSKLVGEKWRNLSAKDKSKYEKLAAMDKKRYQEEVEKRRCEVATAESVDKNTDTESDELDDDVFDNQNELLEDFENNQEEYKVTLFKSLTSGYVSDENYNKRLKWFDNFLTTEYNTLTKLFTAFKRDVFNKQ